jgi:hypothetical protein
MMPPAAEIPPLDPDEFMAAYQYAGMVSEYEFLEEVPAIGKPMIKTEDGVLALSNIPENRFGLAIVRHFRGQREKATTFLWRFFALQRLFREERMMPYIRGSGDDREINCAVFEVAATLTLSEDYEFEPSVFFQTVSEVAARMASEEDEET